MTTPLLAGVTTALTGLLVSLSTRPLLRRLPEPVNGEGKTLYRDLATARFRLGTGALAMLGQALAWTVLPRQVQPLWTVLALVAVLLAAVDARTTWLPLPLTRAGWLLMALAVAVAIPLEATRSDTLRTLAGAAVAGGFYWVVWRVTRGGFGFGDVRFAPLLGAATASQSWALLWWGLSLGSLVGAGHAVVRLLRRQSGGFPYAPSMLAGVYLSALISYLAR